MIWPPKLPRLLFDRSLRPAKRSTVLVSCANSLAQIAQALKIVVQKEYGVDLDAAQPSRADLERDVYEPMYPDDAKEAIREEIARLQVLEREFEAGNVSGGPEGLKSHPNSLETQIPRFGDAGIRFAARGAREDDFEALTEQERDFLAEIGSSGDES